PGGRADGCGDLHRIDRQVPGGLVDEHRGQLGQRGSEAGGIGVAVAQVGQAEPGQRVVEFDDLHTRTICAAARLCGRSSPGLCPATRLPVMAATIVPIELGLDDGPVVTLWAPGWIEDGEEWEAFLGLDDELYVFDSAAELAAFVRTDDDHDLVDHPAWPTV